MWACRWISRNKDTTRKPVAPPRSASLPLRWRTGCGPRQPWGVRARPDLEELDAEIGFCQLNERKCLRRSLAKQGSKRPLPDPDLSLGRGQAHKNAGTIAHPKDDLALPTHSCRTKASIARLRAVNRVRQFIPMVSIRWHCAHECPQRSCAPAYRAPTASSNLTISV